MLKLVTPCLASVLVLCLPSSALASSSHWIETEGGRVRLVTAGGADAQGRLRGALQIALKPGWKTYWRDPGDAGVAPSLDLAESTNIAAAEIGFPPPKRFDDGYSVWSGYDRSVSLPVTFTMADPGRFAAIDAALFLGICETICIPVQGEVSFDPASDPDNRQDAAVVNAAYAALPSPANARFGVSQAHLDGDTLVVEAELPDDATGGELFIAGSEGLAFGAPVPKQKDGKTVFEAPVIAGPKDAGAEAAIDYVLVADHEAVSGTIRLP